MDTEGTNGRLIFGPELRALSRREFLQACAVAAAAVGLPPWAVERAAEAATSVTRPAVIWLHFQECTGCSESLLRTSHPAVSELILDLISLDYHETLMAASGTQAEAALKNAVRDNSGRFLCVVEGAIPTKEGGVYCKVGGRTAAELLVDVGGKAGAVVAVGSCASWGGIPSADPNPTGAAGASRYLRGKTVVNIPGCPPNPYNLLGTILQYAAFGTLPALDALGRPKFAYARTIHEDCPRRPHFDAGRFAGAFGDEGHRLGHCLYKLGCKGPRTHASCPLQHFGDVVGAWPVGIGHPCYGCTEQEVAFRLPLHATVEIERPTPPDTYPPIHADHGPVSPVAAGVAGLAVGALVGAGVMAAKKLGQGSKGERKEDEEA